MRSMLKKYAVEERENKYILEDGQIIGGEPNGNFWMTQTTAMNAAKRCPIGLVLQIPDNLFTLFTTLLLYSVFDSSTPDLAS